MLIGWFCRMEKTNRIAVACVRRSTRINTDADERRFIHSGSTLVHEQRESLSTKAVDNRFDGICYPAAIPLLCTCYAQKKLRLKRGFLAHYTAKSMRTYVFVLSCYVECVGVQNFPHFRELSTKTPQVMHIGV